MDDGSRILDAIGSPADLKLLDNDELNILCHELREQIVLTASTNGGHLASSLGAVDLIVALHSVLDCPTDRIVFDVGHQAYAHKLLTGRLDRFDTVRQMGGLSGFPKPSESPYDSHPSGHASDSLSIAAGLAKARDLNGGTETIAAVIGDAALSGGMAWEALNQIGQDQTRMLIVLNDNQMSISHNVGALMRHLGYLRANNQYRHTRDTLQEMMESRGGWTAGLLDWGRNVKESIKQFVIPQSMMFEQLGITCTAPIDGHDIAALREIFDVVIGMDGPVLVHVVTKKGIGYAPSRENPELFHGVGPFDIASGTRIKPDTPAPPTYTKVFGDALLAEAADDPDVVAITAAMADGTGLAPFSETYPDRFFDVGIAEEHAVGFAAGLATGGKKPVVAIYSTFMQRAIDQAIIDGSLADLNIVFCLDRAGLVGDDGPTHHGVFDLAYMRMIPGMRVLCPSNEVELVCALHTALQMGGPFSIRYPRGNATGIALPSSAGALPFGRAQRVREGNDVVILAFGRMVGFAVSAADILSAAGIEARVVDMRWAKPIDEAAVSAAADAPLVVTIEEGVAAGGAGEGVLDIMARLGIDVPTLVLSLPDEFVEQGKVEQLFAKLGLDADGIAAAIREKLGR